MSIESSFESVAATGDVWDNARALKATVAEAFDWVHLSWPDENTEAGNITIMRKPTRDGRMSTAGRCGFEGGTRYAR